MIKKYSLLILSVVILFAACINKGDLDFKNIKADNWTPDWAFPLINAQLTLKNLVKTNTYVSQDASGMYSLHYSGRLFSVKAADFVNIPDQHFQTGDIASLQVPVSLPSFTGTIKDSFSNNFNYTDTSGAQLQHIKMKSGNIHLNLTSTYNQNLSVILSFPNITKNGIALQLPANVNYPSTNTDVNVDLSGYTIDLTNNNTTNNYMAYKVVYTISGSGQPIAQSNRISASIDLSNVKYSYIDGHLGKYSVPIPHDTILVSIFNNILNANIFLRNPKLHLSFANSFGLGVTAQLDSLYGLTNKGQRVPMTLPSIAVNGATTLGTTANSVYDVDSTNSTIQNMLNPAPNQIIYGGAVNINQTPGTAYNFITDTSSITMSLDAELPAWFRIIDFSLQDTMKMLMPKDTNILEKAEFKMLVRNAFPVYSSVQLYFTDEQYNILDSLITPTNNLIAPAPVNANGVVNGYKDAISTFAMEHGRYEKFAGKVRWGLIRGNLKSSGTGDVQIHNTDSLRLKLALRFTLNISPNSLQ